MAYTELDLDVFDGYEYKFDPEKSRLLERERGINFGQIVAIIESKEQVRLYTHHNPAKYPDQFVYQVEFDKYVYTVPFVVEGKAVFLKTIYPSRKATKLWRRKT